MEYLNKKLSYFRDLHRDAKLIIIANAVAATSVQSFNVVRTIYLSILGFNPLTIGLLQSVNSISNSLRMVLFGSLADRYGRKKSLLMSYILCAFYFIVYILKTDFSSLLIASIVGGAVFIGQGNPIVNALLAEKCSDKERTLTVSINNFAIGVLSTFGTLLSGFPNYLQTIHRFNEINSFQILFVVGLVIISSTLLFILPLKEERPRTSNQKVYEQEKRSFLPKKARKNILKFAAVYVVDGFGVGIIMPLFSLWFYLRFNLETHIIGYIFSATRAVETVAFLIAPIIASKIGLIRSVVVARLTSSFLILFITLSPNYLLAALFFASRYFFQRISWPVRQSYMLAVIPPEERASSIALINLSRMSSNAVAPTIGGYLLQSISTSLPFFISSSLVAGAAAIYFLLFRRILPPEESARGRV